MNSYDQTAIVLNQNKNYRRNKLERGGFDGPNSGAIRRVELYFENLELAKKFYLETMGLEASDEQVGHHAKFDSGAGFLCLERKGSESCPLKDKAVLFFEAPGLRSAIAAIGRDRLVQSEPT